MTIREVLDGIMAATGKTQAELADSIGWSPQQLSQKVVRDTLRLPEFFDILDTNGVEILFRLKGSEEYIRIRRKGHGRRVKGMSDLVTYDTGMSYAVSNSFFSDGVNEYDETGEAQELYQDQNGRYFFARYHADDPSKDSIIAVPAGVAAAFIEKYGTTIDKNPE